MAQPTNTFDSYDNVGAREDLADVIYNISPVETPFMSNAAKSKATNKLHEWQTDSLASASTSNAAIDGDDISGGTVAATTRLNNRTQIFTKAVTVADSVSAHNNAGRGDEMAYQMAKRAKELKRDIESTLVYNQAKVTGNSTLASKLSGLGAWVATNDIIGGTGSPAGASPSAGGATARTDAGTKAALTEANLNLAIRGAWASGGEPNMIMCGPVNKTKITAFVGNATRFKDASDRKIVNAVDIYVSDFGELSVVPNRFQREQDVWVLDMDMWAVAYFRDFQQQELAKTGDSSKRMLLAELTLESRQEAASGMVADCTIT